MLSDGDGEKSDIRDMNIIMRRTPQGLSIEADARHVEMVIIMNDADLVGGRVVIWFPGINKILRFVRFSIAGESVVN